MTREDLAEIVAPVAAGNPVLEEFARAAREPVLPEIREEIDRLMARMRAPLTPEFVRLEARWDFLQRQPEALRRQGAPALARDIVAALQPVLAPLVLVVLAALAKPAPLPGADAPKGPAP